MQKNVYWAKHGFGEYIRQSDIGSSDRWKWSSVAIVPLYTTLVWDKDALEIWFQQKAQWMKKGSFKHHKTRTFLDVVLKTSEHRPLKLFLLLSYGDSSSFRMHIMHVHFSLVSTYFFFWISFVFLPHAYVFDKIRSNIAILISTPAQTNNTNLCEQDQKISSKESQFIFKHVYLMPISH